MTGYFWCPASGIRCGVVAGRLGAGHLAQGRDLAGAAGVAPGVEAAGVEAAA